MGARRTVTEDDARQPPFQPFLSSAANHHEALTAIEGAIKGGTVVLTWNHPCGAARSGS
jgi:hypothetical protein